MCSLSSWAPYAGGVILFMGDEGCSKFFIMSPVAITILGNYDVTYVTMIGKLRALTSSFET